MKKGVKMITTVMFLMTFYVSASKAQTLVVWQKDGSTTEVELYTLPRVQFENEKMLITSSVVNLEFDKNDILQFTYKGVGTSISTLNVNYDYEQDNGRIIFHEISSVDKIAVYNTNGILVPIPISIQGKDAILSLASIPSGVYLLSVNGRTTKFTKK